MPPRTTSSDHARGKAIRERRTELNLTIEEAAQKASVGTKTWARYETGAAIRQDKVRGVCKALKWTELPDAGEADNNLPSFESMRDDPHWPNGIEEAYGMYAAASFVIGSDILMDHLEEDLNELRSLPRGTHIGQLGASWIADEMPQRFLTRYDYELIYEMRLTLTHLKDLAQNGLHFTPHRVLDEIMLHLIVEEARFLMEETAAEYGLENEDGFASWDEWVSDVCEDDDVVTFLFSETVPCWEGSDYHYDRWLEEQFNVDL